MLVCTGPRLEHGCLVSEERLHSTNPPSIGNSLTAKFCSIWVAPLVCCICFLVAFFFLILLSLFVNDILTAEHKVHLRVYMGIIHGCCKRLRFPGVATAVANVVIGRHERQRIFVSYENMGPICVALRITGFISAILTFLDEGIGRARLFSITECRCLIQDELVVII